MFHGFVDANVSTYAFYELMHCKRKWKEVLPSRDESHIKEEEVLYWNWDY